MDKFKEIISNRNIITPNILAVNCYLCQWTAVGRYCSRQLYMKTLTWSNKISAAEDFN